MQSSLEQPTKVGEGRRDIETEVAALLAQMTLAEKIGQMTQVEKNSLTPEDVTRYFIGSVLSGGGGHPEVNNPQTWYEMTAGFQQGALRTRLGIPLLYGVDAVHGHNNMVGATIFPHNIGLGASRDTDLVRRIGRATAVELAATAVQWNFAPAVTVPQDIRWGRTYEGFGQDTGLVSEMGVAYLRGLQDGDNLASQHAVLGSVKHYLGDGGAGWGTVRRFPFPDEFWGETEREIGIDQGVTEADEAELRRVHLAPYVAALEAGALNVMVSYTSWQGLKMHAQRYLLTDVLKDELGFAGFLITDWMAINQIDPDYYTCVTASVNAGIDMIMVPFDYKRFIATLTEAVAKGDVPLSRIDDAVTRILRVKLACGLWEHPLGDIGLAAEIGGAAHRALAREAAAKSAVLLKNEGGTLPMAKDTPQILVAGEGADDLGMQCGGWTIEWMGMRGRLTEGTTLLEALRATAAGATIRYAAEGDFGTGDEVADIGLVVLAEPPYAEGVGDRADLNLPASQAALVERMRARCRKLVVVLYSGRPLVLGEVLNQCDALVAAWLPGSEGQGVADVLFGDEAFVGKLPHSWPKSMDQVPLKAMRDSGERPEFEYGFGLKA